jgi:hypothetical protein
MQLNEVMYYFPLAPQKLFWAYKPRMKDASVMVSKLAEKIMARRPYKTVAGLIKVKGIGPNKL